MDCKHGDGLKDTYNCMASLHGLTGKQDSYSATLNTKHGPRPQHTIG